MVVRIFPASRPSGYCKKELMGWGDRMSKNHQQSRVVGVDDIHRIWHSESSPWRSSQSSLTGVLVPPKGDPRDLTKAISGVFMTAQNWGLKVSSLKHAWNFQCETIIVCQSRCPMSRIFQSFTHCEHLPVNSLPNIASSTQNWQGAPGPISAKDTI